MSSMSRSQINLARKKLSDALGDDFKIYLQNMKLWFRQKITKENFDVEARKLLNPDIVHLHNEFLLAVLNKCHCLCQSHAVKDSSSHFQNKDKQKKGKLKRKCRPMRATFEHRFQPVSFVQYAPHAVAKDPQEDNRLSFCSRDYTLPDISMIHGRMFVTAWDCGLDGVDDNSARLMMLAVQQQLKTILMAVFSRRNAYKVREGKFQYAMGTPPINPYIRNANKISDRTDNSNQTSISALGEHVPSIKPTIDQCESEIALQIASSGRTQHLPPVSPFDLLEALMIHKSCISSHTVYAINIERIITRLWHPSHDDIEQENIHSQEERLRRQLLTEQTITG
ncbi:transcriptional adapter 1-like isoform X1 [Centruroides vittatus]|uniref:transcriptional adapter 1-like isoform X1 n=1 Tax=Centruroides vittatus TaxID=120091 RepID=UPI00350F57CF